MADPQVATLVAGTAQCDLLPALGGSIARWTIDGQDMLRSASAEVVARGDRLGLAAFPLIPWSNRIGHARFTFGGIGHRLRANFAPEPHAIHGTAWEDGWTFTRTGADSAQLGLVYAPDGRWPWPFTARQDIMLSADRLVLRLSARNLADEAVPLSCGWHPYFDGAGAWLRLPAARVWENGPDMLPTRAQDAHGAFDFRDGAQTLGRPVDHCFHDWDGKATLAWADRPLALELSAAAPAAVVYIAPDGTAFCVEPVQHLNNALNRADATPAMPLVEPGASITLVVTLRAFPRESLEGKDLPD